MPQQHEWVVSSKAIDERIASLQRDQAELQNKLSNIQGRLSRLENLKGQLQEEFGDPAPEVQPICISVADALPASLTGRKPTRKEQVVQYFLKHGAQKRSLVVSATGIPAGTVAYIMRDRDTFRELRGKRWDVTEEIRRRASSQQPNRDTSDGNRADEGLDHLFDA